jgi:tryptophan synthase
MKVLCQIADSFIYVVSRMGVTGVTGKLDSGLPDLLARVHKYSGNKPAAVGFGVSTREQFLMVGGIAEGVVIGSQMITTIANAPLGQAATKIKEYCASISGQDQISNGTTREVGMAEAINEAKEPEGVQVDGVISKPSPSGPGLVEQIEALNTNGSADPNESAFTIWRIWRSICGRVSYGLLSGAGRLLQQS